VEVDPYSFGLQIEEVRRRRQLVDEVGDEVEKMRQELRKTVANAAAKSQSFNPDVLPDPESFEEDDDYAAEFEQQRQQEIMREQDEQLDFTFRTVGNLRQQADVMGRELEEQGQLLDEVDTLADRVGGKLQTGMKNLGIVIKRNEGKEKWVWSNIANGSRHVVKLLYRGSDYCFDTALGHSNCYMSIVLLAINSSTSSLA
jgi:member of the syntaxin family of t-SNAREs